MVRLGPQKEILAELSAAGGPWKSDLYEPEFQHLDHGTKTPRVHAPSVHAGRPSKRWDLHLRVRGAENAEWLPNLRPSFS